MIHIFTHHIEKTEDKPCELLHLEMVQCLDWVEKLGKVVLREVNISVKDYVDTITSPGVPLDFIAIVVLCRLYHIHICIYASAGMWCTI